MDKSVGRDKRRKDKHHKKPPPAKPTPGGPNKPQKETVPASAPLIVCDDHFSRRPIESNWNSTKNLPSSEGSDSEDEQLRAADFEGLLQMPPSVSGHLFLSTEKHWISESEEGLTSGGKSGQQYGQRFQIDTKQLTASLATIPFYERNDYPSELFSKQEIDSMKLKAQYESKKYDELCQRLKPPGRMGDKQQVPKPPVKCLIGTDSRPPQPERIVEDPAPPLRPVPCLVGPMALPPELRNDPNVTGGRSQASLVIRLSEADITADSQQRNVTPPSGESVPIRNDEPTTSEQKLKEDTRRVESKSEATGKETKEDIQQWLDDILDM
ncbi:AAEL003394-PA [Aedes aegypti]|uniref:AAEL003394-PA n=1 Tax=Aedes aegypti TaxID=7159 RepID=Q17FM6_AEDAE|nr:AAEL003394-PA [Aedes aegypti]